MGEALLQKTHTVDFLTKKRVKNNGIVQQYYVENSHPPIISRKSLLRYRMNLKDDQICGDIHGRAKVPLRANMPSQGSSSAKTAVQSLEEHLGAPGKISSMCGDALTESRTELINVAQKRSRRKI
ncbi:Site-specific recombinase [Desulfosporosinus metallidurans]|uniref:Site-specific recombinase n=1 Tax=Desulfosporosinus metallidurans TaxID=1888891 RepID=A0A1Q8QJ76_9FIRM|nr:Site-specific recombinase [Desulfosporosinus metallidurans]